MLVPIQKKDGPSSMQIFPGGEVDLAQWWLEHVFVDVGLHRIQTLDYEAPPICDDPVARYNATHRCVLPVGDA